MGDEKRHVDHLEEAARKAEADLRDDLEKAVEFEKADVAETHREWHDQLHNDHAELVADVARDKEEIREALDDARHPERIVHAAEEKLAHAADEARDVVRAVEHPSVIVDDAKEALAEKKHALDETAATIAAEFTSPADKKRLPVVLRVFGVLLITGSGVALPVIAKTMYQAVTMFDSGAMRGEGISTIVVTFVNLAVLVALAVTLIVFGVRASSATSGAGQRCSPTGCTCFFWPGLCAPSCWPALATSLFPTASVSRSRWRCRATSTPRCSKNAAPIARPARPRSTRRGRPGRSVATPRARATSR